jgi:RNA polymerase sigma factor (sigma-70 family)
MQPAADQVLIGRIARGDRLAMQVLFARHHVRIYRFVLRLLRDEMAAEDVISDVFLDVWRQASRFEGRSAVSTWLIAIARFKALSMLRKRREDALDEETADSIEEPKKWTRVRNCASASPRFPLSIARLSISSITTRNRWRKWRRSLEFRRTP